MMVLQVEVTTDEQDTDGETDIIAAMSSRGRRSALVVPRPSKNRKSSIDKRGNT